MPKIEHYQIEHSFLPGYIAVEVDEEIVQAYEWQGKPVDLWKEINTFWFGHEDRLDDAESHKLAVLKLLAEAILSRAPNYSVDGIIRWMGSEEGWPPLTGEFGIKLVAVEPFQYEADDFVVTKKMIDAAPQV